jgi:phosphate transport system permease protein
MNEVQGPGPYDLRVEQRHRRGRRFRGLFFASTAAALAALAVLLVTVLNASVGLVALESRVDPATLSDRPLDELSRDELLAIVEAHASRATLRRLNRERPLVERDPAELYAIVVEEVLEEEVVGTWPLWDSLSRRPTIEAELAAEHPRARLEWRSWLRPSFLIRPMSSHPLIAGVRTAVLGSLWMGLLTVVVAFPLGVATAVYLEEYANRGWLQRLIQTNIDNLAGVPSIIYGMLGLAIFVRALEPITSGAIAGVADSNGRTLLSASLTMALLILPVIIINAQEAIRAVPGSLRQASFGLGGTRWQTVWNHVLPAALPGILTGTILGVSRLVGETAPLIVVGASTYIVSDPDGPFSKFTVLPIQIYNWTTRPQDEFRHMAAAAILVLLLLLLSMNAAAVWLRNRARRGWV